MRIGTGHRAMAAKGVGFDRPIGQNQGIQIPLGRMLLNLRSAWVLMAMHGGSFVTTIAKQSLCSLRPNGAKVFLGGRSAGYQACLASRFDAKRIWEVMGYAREFSGVRAVCFRSRLLLTRAFAGHASKKMILPAFAKKGFDQPKV